MKAYEYEMMMSAFDHGDIDLAKHWLYTHFNRYTRMVMGKASESGAVIPELSCFTSYLPEIKLVTRKKETPIIFDYGTDRLNCIGISNNYAYFIRMSSRLAIELPTVVKTEIVVESKPTMWQSMMNAIRPKKEVTSAYPSIQPVVKRPITNGIDRDFKVSKYWFRSNFRDVLAHFGTVVTDVEMKDLETYRLLPDQYTKGISIRLTDEEISIHDSRVSTKHPFFFVGIHLTQLSIGALYTIAELTNRQELTK